MKKLILLITLFLLVFFGTVFAWWTSVTKPVSTDSSKTRIVIVRGKGASQIANDLYKADLIKSPLAFKFYVQLTGQASSIGAGEFEIAKNLTMFQVLEELSGSPLELWVTIPEGLRKEEIVDKFIKGLEISPEREKTFRSEFLDASEEGKMYPDTYLFPRDVSGTTVANNMIRLFEEKTNELKSDIAKSELDLEEIITLASIVERETKTNEERPIVAGIYFNRLDEGIALQADATAQYAVANIRCLRTTVLCTNWWVQPTLADLEIDSPYNTYKYPGLPPSPIANPGLPSIEAVVRPAESDYFYYIHEDNGTIHYARTLSEHNANISKYLR